jgi:acyl-coenzyme A thioesterase PaaI-like protein
MIGKAASALTELLPANLKHTLQIRGVTLVKIPLLFFVSPYVVEVNESRAEIRIPLSWRTKNHLGSMYFGALAIGADAAGGLIAWRLIDEANKHLREAGQNERMDLVFKDFKAEFLKRPEGDVHFVCEEGRQIKDLVTKALKGGERESMPVHITARVPSKLGDEPVAQFILTLSVKKSTRKN